MRISDWSSDVCSSDLFRQSDRFTLLSSRNAARPSSHEWSIHPVKKRIMKINRREERKTQRRASLLEVARRSFFEKGYAPTTMSGIAATLGGSKSTLWRYFSSKAELFAAVLDDATAEFKRELGELLLSHQGVRNTLMRLCLHFIEKMVRSAERGVGKEGDRTG